MVTPSPWCSSGHEGLAGFGSLLAASVSWAVLVIVSSEGPLASNSLWNRPCREWAEPVWRIQSVYSQKLRGRRYYQNIMHINDTQSGCICHLLLIIAVTATMCWALAVGQVFICEPDMHLSTDPYNKAGSCSLWSLLYRCGNSGSKVNSLPKITQGIGWAEMQSIHLLELLSASCLLWHTMLVQPWAGLFGESMGIPALPTQIHSSLLSASQSTHLKNGERKT